MQINQHKYFSYLVNLCISILEFKLLVGSSVIFLGNYLCISILEFKCCFLSRNG